MFEQVPFRRLFCLFAIAAGIASVPLIVGAHATPRTSGSETEAHSIQLRFSERIEPAASSIVVYGPEGSPVQDGGARVDTSDPKILSVDLHDGGSGTYAVFWQVISADDGHFTKGAYTFSVGPQNEVATNIETDVQTQHSAALRETLAIGAELLGEALLLGVLLMLSLSRSLIFFSDTRIRRRLRRRCTALVIGGTLLSLGGICCYFIIRAGDLHNDTITYIAALKAFVHTAAGRYALLRAAAVSATAIAYTLSRERWAWGCIIITAFLRAGISHAAASEVLPNFSIFTNTIHLLAKDLWIGGLAAFCIVLLPLLRGKTTAVVAEAWKAMHRIALYSLLIGGVTGCFIVWLHLKSPGNLLTSHWGMRFFQIEVFAILLLLFRLYQHRCLRRMTRTTPSTTKDSERMQMAWLALPIEALTGIIVLLLSGQMIITSPPLQTATRSFDSFALLCILVAAGIATLALVLLRQTRRMPQAPDTTFRPPETAAAPIFVLASLPALALLLLHAHPHLVFESICERNGDVWTETVPVRAGVEISDIPVMGCTTGSGYNGYHFAERKAYEEFLKGTEKKD